MLVALLLTAACTATKEEFGSAPSIALDPAATPTLVEGPIRGTLPDGTVFDVLLDPLSHQTVEAVTAGVVVETEAGEIPLGEVRFIRGRVDGIGWLSENLYRVTAGDWSIGFELSEPAFEALGPDRRAVVADAIDVSTNLGLPVIDLASPLRWAGDDQAVMEVRYETFAVRRGCDPGAVACNPTHAVQVASLPDGTESELEVTIESYALRPESDPHYIPPGPLTARTGHDLIWTGTEMIVWGGVGQGSPPADGAAFDPSTGGWDTLPPFPPSTDPASRAVWAGDQLIVVSPERTLAWFPGTENWQVVGPGSTVPPRPGLMLWTGSEVVTWAEDGFHRFDPSAGSWTDLPDAGVGSEGVFRVTDGSVYVVGSGECDRRLIAEYVGDGWRRLPDLSSIVVGTLRCSAPEHTAGVGDRLILWVDSRHPTLTVDPVTGRAEETDPYPLQPTEQPSGPLSLDDRILVPRGLEGAIYDPATGQWSQVTLPGFGADTDMVWTGEEVLKWDKCCYGPDDIDAWRWVAPD